MGSAFASHHLCLPRCLYVPPHGVCPSQVMPRLLLARYLRLGNSKREEEDDDKSSLTLEEFLDVLVRVAIVGVVAPSRLRLDQTGRAEAFSTEEEQEVPGCTTYLPAQAEGGFAWLPYCTSTPVKVTVCVFIRCR